VRRHERRPLHVTLSAGRRLSQDGERDRVRPLHLCDAGWQPSPPPLDIKVRLEARLGDLLAAFPPPPPRSESNAAATPAALDPACFPDRFAAAIRAHNHNRIAPAVDPRAASGPPPATRGPLKTAIRARPSSEAPRPAPHPAPRPAHRPAHAVSRLATPASGPALATLPQPLGASSRAAQPASASRLSRKTPSPAGPASAFTAQAAAAVSAVATSAARPSAAGPKGAQWPAQAAAVDAAGRIEASRGAEVGRWAHNTAAGRRLLAGSREEAGPEVHQGCDSGDAAAGEAAAHGGSFLRRLSTSWRSGRPDEFSQLLP
jgi:hypothetical protein